MLQNIHKGAFIGRKTKGWETEIEKELYDQMWNMSEWTAVCSPFNETILGEIDKLNRRNIHKKRIYEAKFTENGANITVTEYHKDSVENRTVTIGEYLILHPV